MPAAEESELLKENPSHGQTSEVADHYAQVESDALAEVNNPERFKELVAEYRERFGSIIDTDKARELFPAYRDADNETRGKITQAVHEASGRIAGAAWEETLKDPSVETSNDVVILAGGSGSGKGAILSKYIHRLQDSGHKSPHAIYDTTLSNFDLAKKRISQALEYKKDVTILYVHRPIELAQEGVAIRQELTGRSVLDSAIIGSHYNSQKNIFELHRMFENDPRVNVVIIDNSSSLGESREGNVVDTLAPVRYTSIEDVTERLRKARSIERAQTQPTDRATTDESQRTDRSSDLELEGRSPARSRRSPSLERETPASQSELEHRGNKAEAELEVSSEIELNDEEIEMLFADDFALDL